MSETNIDESLVRRLITSQFPQWSDLRVARVASDGWDNRTFHLGNDMKVRLPSAEGYILQTEKEYTWLPRLAPLLPLPIPVPIAMGKPAAGYPWHWSIYRWLDGEIATVERIAELREFALTLAGFLRALERIDATGGPPPGAHNCHRGGPLTVYDGETRRAISALHGKIDTEAATAVWEAGLATNWRDPPVWFHGDVAAGNLLVKGGRLSAVIDFGTSGVGDPACDLSVMWTLLEGESRDVFREALPRDAATWARGRGWTLWKALIVLAELSETDTLKIARSRRIIDDVLADHRRFG